MRKRERKKARKKELKRKIRTDGLTSKKKTEIETDEDCFCSSEVNNGFFPRSVKK